LSTGERVWLRRPGETDRGKVFCRVNNDQSVVTEFDKRLELAAADPEVCNLDGEARVAISEAICEIDAVACDDECARVNIVLVL
jgi:hypothetical protein